MVFEHKNALLCNKIPSMCEQLPQEYYVFSCVIIGTNDQSVIIMWASLRRFLHFSRLFHSLSDMSPWSSCPSASLGVDCQMFATCTGLCISSRCSSTDIAGACIYGCTCTTTAAAVSRELEIPINSTVSWPSSFLTQPRLTGHGTCGCCWILHLQIPAW